jgi:hypothetical protein
MSLDIAKRLQSALSLFSFVVSVLRQMNAIPRAMCDQQVSISNSNFLFLYSSARLGQLSIQPLTAQW